MKSELVCALLVPFISYLDFKKCFSILELENFAFYANQFRFEVVSVSALDELSLPRQVIKVHKNANFPELKTTDSNWTTDE